MRSEDQGARGWRSNVYRSLSSEPLRITGYKALAMLLAKYERIYSDPFESVDIYTKQCSVGVYAVQLARMGATLANNGVNPPTGEQVIKREDIPCEGAIAVFAPPLDEAGKSVAQKVIEFVAEKLNYNLYSPASFGLK